MTAATLSYWLDRVRAAGRAGLKSRPADDRDPEIRRLRAKLRAAEAHLPLACPVTPARR